MTTRYDDPKLIAEAKRQAAGPLGKHLGTLKGTLVHSANLHKVSI